MYIRCRKPLLGWLCVHLAGACADNGEALNPNAVSTILLVHANAV